MQIKHMNSADRLNSSDIVSSVQKAVEAVRKTGCLATEMWQFALPQDPIRDGPCGSTCGSNNRIVLKPQYAG